MFTNCVARAKLQYNKKLKTYKNIKHQQGNKNSQYGMMWITNLKISKRIKKTDTIPEGWVKGRILKQQD